MVNLLLNQQKQSGGFLRTLLASIGVPLLLKALTGKGLQVDKKRSKQSVNVHVPKVQINKNTSSKDGGLVLPMDYRSPPFIGTWDNPIGMGIKKKATKKGKGLLLGKNSPFNGILILGAIL